MATRDSSQKPGFVYNNIYELYKNAKVNGQEQVFSLSSESRVWRAEDLQGVEVKKYEPKELVPVTANNAELFPKNENPFEDLKGNLKKLQDLHSKLRFMLKELEDLVGKK